MRILALESAWSSGSVAVLEANQLLGESSLRRSQRAAQWLVPLILDQLRSVGWAPRDVQLYAVARGPGSFTGTRVGVTIAKTLAYAAAAEVMGVNTLQAIAVQAFGDTLAFAANPCSGREKSVRTVLDAQRQQLFSARFQQSPESAIRTAEPTLVVDTTRWLGQLQAGDVVAGPGLHGLLGRLPTGIVVVEQRLWAPRAETVGRIAHHRYLEGQRDDPWRLAPSYYRPSAAEEKGSRDRHSR